MANGNKSKTPSIQKMNHSRTHNISKMSDNLISKPNKNRGAKKSKIKRKDYEKRFVAMDCEMVGVGPEGKFNMVARVSIVDEEYKVLLDKYVQPYRKVTDYRTMFSGIRQKDIVNGEDFHLVRSEVLSILWNKILIGHAVDNDLNVLFIKHPYRYTRDTAKYKPLANFVTGGATPSLKRLSKAILDIDIQTGEHDSVEDARATMKIYNQICVDWEKYIKKHSSHNS